MALGMEKTMYDSVYQRSECIAISVIWRWHDLEDGIGLLVYAYNKGLLRPNRPPWTPVSLRSCSLTLEMLLREANGFESRAFQVCRCLCLL